MMFEMRNLALAIVVCLIFCELPNYAQQDSLVADPASYADLVKREYGLDQSLVNGVLYHGVYQFEKNHPYLFADEFRNGSLILNDQIYHDVPLKYDLYFQHVELEYKNHLGGINRIYTITDHVDGFSFGEVQFEKLVFEEGQSKYYQVIRTPCFTSYIFWEKSMVSTVESASYSDARRTFFLEVNDDIRAFKGNTGFSGFFPEEYQKEIRRLLRKNSFKFRNARPEEVILNLNTVCNLLEEKQTL